MPNNAWGAIPGLNVDGICVGHAQPPILGVDDHVASAIGVGAGDNIQPTKLVRPATDGFRTTQNGYGATDPAENQVYQLRVPGYMTNNRNISTFITTNYAANEDVQPIVHIPGMVYRVPLLAGHGGIAAGTNLMCRADGTVGAMAAGFTRGHIYKVLQVVVALETHAICLYVGHKTIAQAITALALNTNVLVIDHTAGVGVTFQMAAIPVPSLVNDPSVTWTSSVVGVATIGAATGLITTVADGATVITATSNENGAITAVCNLTVISLTALALNTGAFGLTHPDTFQMAAIPVPFNVADGSVTWASSAVGAATIGANTGLITTVAAGPTNITATSVADPAITATIVLTVA